MFQTDDTIAAVSSAGGPGYIGILRISGPDAFKIIESFTADLPPGQSFSKKNSWHRLTGRFRLDKSITCPCEYYLFHAPRSYTTQNMVELHLPGSPPLLQLALQTILQAGARMARPGEFTSRAFLNNRIDLTEAQAVAAMINAGTDSQLKAAERLLEGELRRRCDSLREGLSHILALIETGIDFSQEDIEFIEPDQLRQDLHQLNGRIQTLLKNNLSWQQLNLTPQVVLVGPPNAGKSSLTNALTGMDRGIVSLVAGTTRDRVTSPLQLTHGECLLVDTAGLGPVDDPLAQVSQHNTTKAIQSASLILWIADAQNPQAIVPIWNSYRHLSSPALLIFNKIDLVSSHPSCPITPPLDTLYCSALNNTNIDTLKQTINTMLADRITQSPQDNDIALTSSQQVELQAAAHSLNNALTLAQNDAPEAELIALEIRDTLHHLAVISGEVTTEDILEDIFGRFCIGK